MTTAALWSVIVVAGLKNMEGNGGGCRPASLTGAANKLLVVHVHISLRTMIPVLSNSNICIAFRALGRGTLTMFGVVETDAAYDGHIFLSQGPKELLHNHHFICHSSHARRIIEIASFNNFYLQASLCCGRAKVKVG